jgi:phage-related protein (TIGR01555 family)
MSLIDKTMSALNFLSEVAPLKMNAVSRIDSITNPVTGLGTTEDSSMHAVPTMGRRLTYKELMILYIQSDLAQRIVDEVVDDALRQGFTVKDEDSGELVKEPKKLNINTAIEEAMKEARLAGGAAILMLGDLPYDQPVPEEDPEDEVEETEEEESTEEEDDTEEEEPEDGEEEEPEEEDDEKPKKDTFAVSEPKYPVKGLLVLDRTELSVSKYDYDPSSPSFGQPLTYMLSPRGAIATDSGNVQPGMEVHRSHLLFFRGQRLPKYLQHAEDGWGDSVLQASWDRIRNFEQTELSMGNIVQRFEVATYSIDGLGEVLSSPNGKEKILDRLKLIQRTMSMVRAVVLDKTAGETYDRQFSSVNGLDTIWDRLAHSVAKSARQSMTQLFGAAPSGLATDDESGRANWRKQIKTLQSSQILPALQKYFDRCHGKPTLISFQALDESTATEEAEIAKATAETRKIYVEIGSATPNEFRSMMVREGVIVREEMDEEDLMMGDAEGDLGEPQPEDDLFDDEEGDGEEPDPLDTGEEEPPLEDDEEEPDEE